MSDVEQEAIGEAPEAEQPTAPPEWTSWPDEKLLDVRLCDLELRIEGTELEGHIGRLHHDLEEHHIRFRPYFWFSDEWFTPDDVPGIAVPFYMGHPRLAKLD